MSWAARRQLIYFFGVLIIVALAVFGFIRRATSVPASCVDRKQNQGESGVDCGGPCNTYCPNELSDPKVRWQRTFTITPGIVHAVAYIEHNHPNAAARNVAYTFKLYDERNTLITERTGTTFIGPMGRSAIVETLIPVGASTPTSVHFEVTKPVIWDKITPVLAQSIIKTERTSFETLDKGTRLTAIITNESRNNFKNVEVVAIVYGNDGNAVTVSKSTVATLPALGSATVYFTWPFVIPSSSGRIEIVPRANPFTATSL